MLGWLLDRAALRPSRSPIELTDHKTAFPVDLPSGRLDVYRYAATSEPEVFILKFPGTAGRAERMSCHPSEFFRPGLSEVWCINPPGYGLSAGPAGLKRMVLAHLELTSRLMDLAAGRPVLVSGRSLGTVSALMVAARFPVAGVYLRDPVPLREVVRSRYRRLFLGMVTGWASAYVPPEFDTLVNAAKVSAPGLMILSGKDRIIPLELQHQVVAQYGGEKRSLVLAEADHDQPPADAERPAYAQELAWLAERVAVGVTQPLEADWLDDRG